MRMDKKKEQHSINYILLERIGKAVVKPIPTDQLQQILESLQ